jgi:hypothetical protein
MPSPSPAPNRSVALRTFRRRRDFFASETARDCILSDAHVTSSCPRVVVVVVVSAVAVAVAVAVAAVDDGGCDSAADGGGSSPAHVSNRR